MENTNKYKIGVIGLGYVGLPLALAFSKVRSVIGFDISHERINELNIGIDRTKEFETEELLSNKNIKYSL